MFEHNNQPVNWYVNSLMDKLLTSEEVDLEQCDVFTESDDTIAKVSATKFDDSNSGHA